MLLHDQDIEARVHFWEHHNSSNIVETVEFSLTMISEVKEAHCRFLPEQSSLDLTGYLIKQLDFICQNHTTLASGDILLLNESFTSPSAHVRAKSVDVLASLATTQLCLRAGLVGEVILWHTDDVDARVRDRAFDCLRSWLTSDLIPSNPTEGMFSKIRQDRVDWVGSNLNAVYLAACRGLTDTESLVRRTSLLLLARLCSTWPDYELVDISPSAIEIGSVSTSCDHPTNIVSLAGDAFSRVCSRVQDSERQVRQLAVQLLSDLAKFVPDDCLIRTLGRAVMSDRSVRRTVADKSAVLSCTEKTGVLPTASVNSMGILPTGPNGALISGLEDDYFEVRCATLDTIAHIASLSAEFALSCQDLLVDMLTDDIQEVRLTAVTALGAVGDQVSLQSDQMAIITSAMTEGSGPIRRGLHQILSKCRLSSAPCLISLLSGLLHNLRRYPQDRNSLWQCAAFVGERHPAFVESCLASLLRTHSWLGSPEPNWEDPAYLTVLLLVLNAEIGAPGMAAKFPRHLASTKMYLRELVPSLLPKRVHSACSELVNPADFVHSVKRPRLDIKLVSACSGPFDIVCGFLHTLLRRIILLLIEVYHKLRNNFGPSVTPDLPVSFLRPRLTLLSRLVFTDLQSTVSRLDRTGQMDGFVHWIILLSSTGLLLFSLVFNCFRATTRPQAQSRLLKRALHLVLMAEYLFCGQTPMERTLVNIISRKIFELMQARCLHRPLDYQTVSSCLHGIITLLASLVSDPGDDTDFENFSREVPASCLLTNALLLSSKRLFPVFAILLQPKPMGPPVSTLLIRHSHITPSVSLRSSNGVDEAAWSLPFRFSPATSAAPEVRFTATIASAAIKIRSVVFGLNLETARRRLCVLFRRPDLFRSSSPERNGDCHSATKFFPNNGHFHEWWPPSCAWHPLDDRLAPVILDGLNRPPSIESTRVELRTEVELTSGRWSDAGTIELGLGYRLDSFCDLDCPSSVALTLPVTSRLCSAKVRLIPCTAASHW